MSPSTLGKWCLAFVLCGSGISSGQIKLPAIFGSNMVLQRNQPNRVWGWGQVGDRVAVQIAGQSQNTLVGDDGKWQVSLDAMPAGGPHRMVVRGSDEVTFDNVMVGEVWICSGQSNMAWSVQQANDPDLESLTADFPGMRLISVPRVGTDQPQEDFEGAWEICTPDTVKQFSAVGYFFGRQIHQTLEVPVGLIDNAWGGSACEAWINRELLDGDERFGELMEQWRETEEHFTSGAAAEAFAAKLASWREAAEKAKAVGQPEPRKPRPDGSMMGNQRPANIYNGVLKPTIGYGMRGVIWYQGESNARRAYQYRDLFPLMIKSWRDEWQQGEFPFYYVQLADFRAERPEPVDSDWAELREAQTMAMSKLPNTGEAVILNLGEASDIHPKNKQDVAKRLARWALAKDYGYDLVYRSPMYRSMEKQEGSVILTFEHVAGGLDTFDVRQPVGFTIAGEDHVFHHANAEFVGQGTASQVKVWSTDVPSPVAVRYAWADNPICNVQNREGLPLTPFRTDSWPGVTANQNTR